LPLRESSRAWRGSALQRRSWKRLPEQTLEKDRLDPRVWRIVSVAVLGSFLSQLDATVVNVSLSSLATELHSSLTVIQWVTSGYLLALVLMLPLNGWLVERIGAKRLYLVSFSGFTLASALCALSWSAGSLIGFRLLQGVSGGLMAPMTQLMLVRVAGKHLVRVVGYAAAPILLGPILGPVIAGAILQHATWHWLFLINLPIGALAVVLAFLFLPDDDDTKGVPRGLDVIGLLLLSPGLVLFLYGSDHLEEQTGVTAIGLCLQCFEGPTTSADRLTAFQKQSLLRFGCHSVHNQWPVIRGPDVDPYIPHSCCQRIARRCRLADGSSRTGNDVHLSMAGEVDSALWYQRDIHRRRDGSVFGDVTFSLFKLPSSESADSRRHAVHSRHGHECGGYSVHFCRLWIGT
jgi:Major Facilitator Superfamily